MVGLIPKLLIDMLQAQGGSDLVGSVKRLAEVPADQVYGMNVVYDDAEWNRLFHSASGVLDISAARWTMWP